MKVRIRIAYTADLPDESIPEYVNSVHHSWTQGLYKDIHVVALTKGTLIAEAGSAPKEKP